MVNARWIAVVLVIIGASSYGILSSFIKIAFASGFKDGQITVAQITAGALMLWILVAFNKKSWVNPFRGPWIQLACIGIFGLSLTTIFYNSSLTHLDASLSIVLLFQFTWMTIAMDCIARKRLPRPNETLAIIVIMIGTLLDVNIFGANWSQLSGKGILFGLLSGLTYSLFLFMTGQVKSDLPPLMKSAVMITAAIPMIYLVYPPNIFLDGNTLQLLGWGLMLGFFGQVVPTIAFNVGIPRIGSTLAAMLGSIELPVAIVAAFLLLGEPVLLVQWLGMILILAGILLSEKRSRAEIAKIVRNER
ncbi:DMT family transporter [Paenibacillus sp. GP183]|jgi:drug/metabolite transporter (DMT)-like permease|uniref:EamA family transporter n=1 Tax=Paenibacillus sp. GP183 TaxID=1882751 RepID=UPI000895F582|nr:DMT family transporter [Paenibacillus sp. GP183]SEC17311.1 Threonine/homoserine efflux transporter RhtA [Paenibacillus sp. GP183]